MGEAYTASDDGRTWKMIAFNFNCAARSSNAISSAFCSATLRPGLDGQSLLRHGHEPRAAKFARRWRRRHGNRAINLARREQHRGQQPDKNGQKSNSSHKRLGNKTLWRARWQRFFLGKSFLNTFLTPTAHLLISRFVGVASWCGHEREQFDSTGGWLRPAAGRISASPRSFHRLGALASRRPIVSTGYSPTRRRRSQSAI